MGTGNVVFEFDPKLWRLAESISCGTCEPEVQTTVAYSMSSRCDEPTDEGERKRSQLVAVLHASRTQAQTYALWLRPASML